ncbi:MAG TPA: glycosyltransferase [Nocardioidaceae bacterium]|nr:glycosyltransferase [Nocardioidaceae bacterium]
MREVEIQPVPLERLAQLLSPQRVERLAARADVARELFAHRTLWNINATSKGGGVAEMLQALLAYSRGAGVDARWLVLDGDHEFFTITKRLHNFLHGSPGDGGMLGRTEHAHFSRVLSYNLPMAEQVVEPGHIVLLHDPQTAGLVDGLRRGGAHVVWRCHIGRDTPDPLADIGWAFLRGFIERADRFIFSRREYVPAWVPADRVVIIPPSVDPFSAKNIELDPARVRASLARAGLVENGPGEGDLHFVRRGGSVGEVRAHQGLIHGHGPIPRAARLVVQVSRWDRLKDMTGVLRGFIDRIDALPDDAHLALVGPDTAGVSDDPEGAAVLAECIALWNELPRSVQDRVHLVCLPMDDVDENAHLVNAIQRHASVVVQKSLVEGFGLTVTEAMWKSRPVIASAVGGIQDQIEDGVQGLLIEDPHDLDSFGAALERVLGDDALATKLGEAARERVQDQFLGDRHLIQYVELFESLISGHS